MPARSLRALPAARRVALIALVLTATVATCSSLQAQVFSNTRAVGGVSINAEGLLDNAQIDDQDRLRQARLQLGGELPEQLADMAALRKISLRRLEAAIEKALSSGQSLPEEIELLAGLQQIQYIFVYPEQRDIVLVGPGEGWRVDQRGHIVGATTGRPVMLLDDLLVALRTARQAAQGGISCSIDPTPEGLLRLRRHARTLRTVGNPQQTARGIEEALGVQQISVHGVPPTSHFARVLVAADYRMKRLAMGFEKSPVKGLPNYLSMIRPTGRGMKNMLPRWWLEPSYEPLLASPDRLAWELQGASVKAMTEEDFLTASGQKEHTGKASRAAQRWADNMTEKYEDLAVADPIFGQLRNCMELAVVAALIVKEDLTGKAGYSMPLLMDPAEVAVVELTAPKQIDSKVTMIKKGSDWSFSASGGVQINSWGLADKVQTSDAAVSIRAEAAPEENTRWWWN